MKVFFDTCVYAAEALLGAAAEQMLEATERASWRILASPYLLDELQCVLVERLGFGARLARFYGKEFCDVLRLLSRRPRDITFPRIRVTVRYCKRHSPAAPTTWSRTTATCLNWTRMRDCDCFHDRLLPFVRKRRPPSLNIA